jgi:hypothetical protein
MTEKRRGYAPYSLTRKAGVQSATVNGDIDVIQEIRPVISAGFLDEVGNWKGRQSSDETFFISDTAVGIANGATTLFPNTADADFVDMTGFTDIFIAVKPTNGGNYAMSAVMGPDTHRFANLTPLNSAAELRFCGGFQADGDQYTDVLDDSAEPLTSDVWNIFCIQERSRGQKNMQFKVVNNSGDISTIDFAYLRVV